MQGNACHEFSHRPRLLIVINDKSGRSGKINVEILKKAYGKGYDADVVHIGDRFYPFAPAERVVVLGGDGTLNSIVNAYYGTETEIIYIPTGTLNECAKKNKCDFVLDNCGKADNKYFTYVLAAGTFTPLGYSVDNRLKKKIKAFAYVLGVFRELKVSRIPAVITSSGKTESGEYSLIMAIKSKQCFGLKFNRAFDKDNGLYMLTVKAPASNGIAGLIKLFFPYFRAFFIGFSKEYHSKTMDFIRIKKAEFSFMKSETFCSDGEKRIMPKKFSIEEAELSPHVTVVTKAGVRNLYKSRKESQYVR